MREIKKREIAEFLKHKFINFEELEFLKLGANANLLNIEKLSDKDLKIINDKMKEVNFKLSVAPYEELLKELKADLAEGLIDCNKEIIFIEREDSIIVDYDEEKLNDNFKPEKLQDVISELQEYQ